MNDELSLFLKRYFGKSQELKPTDINAFQWIFDMLWTVTSASCMPPDVRADLLLRYFGIKKIYVMFDDQADNFPFVMAERSRTNAGSRSQDTGQFWASS